jgi:hypothetical protein
VADVVGTTVSGAMWRLAVAVALVRALSPMAHAIAMRLLLRARPEATVSDAADALATSMGKQGPAAVHGKLRRPPRTVEPPPTSVADL